MTADRVTNNSSVFDRSWLKEDEEEEEIETIEETAKKSLDTYFDFLPTGLCLKTNEIPEIVFDTLLYHLAGNEDAIRWQVADACNEYHRFYRKQAYEIAAARLGISPETIETQWCYTARNVPIGNRLDTLTISHHRAVAKVDWSKQYEYLLTCEENGWTVSVFENWLTKNCGIEAPERVHRNDRLFEAQIKADNLERENLELKEQLAKVATSQPLVKDSTIDPGPQLIPGPIAKFIKGVAGYLQGRDYTAVIIHEDGRVEWIPR